MLGKIFLGRYEVQKILGEGGMGRVYLARQTDLQRQVVIKVMHEHVAADQTFRERFQRETLLMARFQHPYAVALYDASLDSPDGPCIVMEYVRGETLDILLARNQRLSPMRVGRILNQLCEVLQAAHGQGIIHRDLKPGNLMVMDSDTPYEKIKVMDFGLAKLIDAQSLQQLVDSGNEFAIGTPAYMCPEQVRGEEVDHRGDLYSVGVMVYEMLTGKLPFDAVSTMDILLAHATETAKEMSEGGVWVSPAVERVVANCMAKKPDNRPANARELAEKFESALKDEGDGEEDVGQTDTDDCEEIEPPVERPNDPSVVVHDLEAWMPESVANFKIKGFVEDTGGQILESEPGRIRLRLDGSAGAKSKKGLLSFLGIGKGSEPFDLELHMRHKNVNNRNKLTITVMLKYLGRTPGSEWRVRCEELFIDLRAYLMGQSEGS